MHFDNFHWVEGKRGKEGRREGEGEDRRREGGRRERYVEGEKQRGRRGETENEIRRFDEDMEE